jgi:lipoic acid synthetase
VKTGSPDPPDPAEPLRVAQAVQRLKLRHCVITGVNRDDLPASGAEFYARTVELVREFNPEVKVEVLTGDFSGEKRALKMVLDVSPEVFNHNLETVERLTPVVRDRRANYRVSLEMLESAKNYRPEIFTKSGLILGMGEDFKEIIRTLRDLREVGCDGLTLGQYLPPSKKHYPVKKYYQPEEFEELEDQARRMGFKGVAAGPLVRSSFRAGEMYEEEFMKRMEE